MDHDLERSARLLDDALSTPTRSLFKASISNRRRFEWQALNDSITLAPSELNQLLNENRSMYNDTMALLGSQADSPSSMQQGVPWTSTVDNLYTEFADILQNTSGGLDILETAAELARCCADTLTVVQKLKSNVNFRSEHSEKWLENERNNWRLLYVLYQDRLQLQRSDQELDTSYFGHSEKMCIDSLFKNESLVRESQLVIDWLERNALEKDDLALHQPDLTYGWEHTLHQLLMPDRIAIGSNVEIVGAIHPDAPHFEGKSLHHLDKENEKQLCRRVFSEIRCGNLERAQELCYNSGHPWRAALLEGWKLYHNPNEKDEFAGMDEDDEIDGEGGMYQDVEGNRNRDLWKLMAIQFGKKKKLDLYEKASVAVLCGDLDNILPVCASWEDFLWAYMRTIVDIRVESEIRDNIIRKYEPLPQTYWEQKMSLDDVFALLQSSKNAAVRSESLSIDHVIQKHLILHQIGDLNTLLATWASDNTLPTHSLRFFAHLIIFFDNLDECPNHENCESVLQAYIKRLSDLNETQLVAYYVSKLTRSVQTALYAAHLEHITENEARRTALNYAEQFGLDVFGVTKRIVESSRNKGHEESAAGGLQGRVTKGDEAKISAIDWLVFYEEQRAELLVQANALIFWFLAMGKLEAAQLAMNKVPQGAVTKLSNADGELELSEELGAAVNEHLSYRAYLEAQEAFNEWFRQCQGRPQPPAALAANAVFTEKVAQEQRVARYNGEVERWRAGTAHAAKRAKTLLYNVLLFPGGWLAVGGGGDADYLRSVCVPEVVMLLYSVLSESGWLEEAVQLADLIASEKYRIYRVYTKEKMAEILEKICEVSVELLKMKKDPWGNATTA